MLHLQLPAITSDAHWPRGPAKSGFNVPTNSPIGLQYLATAWVRQRRTVLKALLLAIAPNFSKNKLEFLKPLEKERLL